MGPKRSAAQALASFTDKRARLGGPVGSSVVPGEFTREAISAAAHDYVTELLARSSNSTTAEHILRDAQVKYLTSDQASWIYYAPGWYKRIYKAVSDHTQPYNDWFNALWDLHPQHHDSIKMFGKDVLMPRFQQVYGQSYRFSGKLFEAEPFPQLLIQALGGMQQLVIHPSTGETYAKAGLVNWYEHGDHYVGPHTDDESNIHPQSPVFTLSLGATRRFVFTAHPKTANPGTVSRVELMLRDGDLLIMGGTTQKTHKHALPKMKPCVGKRVSITLRCFK